MQRNRTRSAPAIEARILRAQKAKLAEDTLVEQERAAILNDRECRQKRAAINRDRLQRNNRRLRDLDSKRFEHERVDSDLEGDLLLQQQGLEGEQFNAKEALRMLEAIERAELNAERAKRAAEIHEEVEREREREAQAYVELDTQRLASANERRTKVLVSRRDAARRGTTERLSEFANRFEMLSRTREADATLRRVELDLNTRAAEAALREKELALSKQILQQREDELIRARRRADRRALGEAEYADYCDELKSFWRVEESRASRLVERALSAKANKAREHHERVQRARANHQRLKQQESAWQDLVETELAQRLNRVTRLQGERLRAMGEVRALGETAQRELMRSRRCDRESETFDKVDRDCRVFNHVVMRHELNEPSW